MLKRFFCTLTPIYALALVPDQAFALSYGSADVTKVSNEVPHYNSSLSNTQKKEPPPLPATARKGYNLEPTSRRTGNRLQYTTEKIPTVSSNSGASENYNPSFRVSGYTGYSTSSMIWNIGYSDSPPFDANILSELTWRDVKNTVVGFGGEYRCSVAWCNRMMLFGDIYANKAYNGKQQDSDYFLDDRQGEFSRSNGSADGSEMRGLKIGIGYDIGMDFQDIGFSLIPSVGYAYDTQEMRLHNSVQTVGDGFWAPSPGYVLDGHSSSYYAKWNGIYTKLESRLRFFNQHELRAAFGFMLNDYDGTGHWNLRDDLAQPNGFKHEANGFTRSISAGYSYWITPEWEFKLDAKYETSKAGPGMDTAFFSDGSFSTLRFNEVKYKSHSYLAGIGYRF